MRVNILVVCFVSMFLLISCSVKREDVMISEKSINSEVKDTIGAIQFNQLRLACEVCNMSEFNLCRGGTDMRYKFNPYLINLYSTDLLKCYDTVYMMPSSTIMDSLSRVKTFYSYPWDLDTLFDRSLGAANQVGFSFPAFTRRVKREIRRSELHVRFDGKIKYNVYDIKMRYFYGGRKEVLIPNIINDRRTVLMTTRVSHVYYILDIEQIRPAKW